MVRQHHGRRLCLRRSRPVPNGVRMWVYAAGVGVLVSVLVTGITGGVAPDSDRPVDYRIVNGAIPEPLTDQPGDPERGRRIVLDRGAGDCIVCHAMPLPQRQFHGTVGPPLDGVGSRYTAGQLRLRIVDPKAINPETVMPAYYKMEGLHRLLERYRGKPILTLQQVEDVIAYLLTLK